MSVAVNGPVTLNVPKPDTGASAVPAVAIDTQTIGGAVWWLCAYADSDNVLHTIWLPSYCVTERSV